MKPRGDAGRVWNAASYARLSRDDGDAGESNSITSQKRIIDDYAGGRPDIRIVAEYEDDGWTGSNFDRPGFKAMMRAVEAGAVDCIVVKDLSRFGRNYLDVGRYLERTFPAMGVRLVAIADGYDGAEELGYAEALMVPVKNLINDNYCAATSAKVKAHLEAKRRRGDFVGPFAPYGYAKDPKDRNRLVIDAEAAEVVRRIFEWRIAGATCEQIAARLNAEGVKCPHELKRSRGCRHHEPLKRAVVSKWNAREVARILENEVYAGVLAQGKTFKPSFRSRAVLPKPRSEWDRVEGAHEAIVDKRTFDLVQDVNMRDTRRPPGAKSIHPLSGMAFCAGCGASMTRHVMTSGKSKVGYYSCSAHHLDRDVCSTHMITAAELEAAVAGAAIALTASSADMRRAWEAGAGAAAREKAIAALAGRERQLDAEIARLRGMRGYLYDDLAKGVIGKDELADFSSAFEERARAAERELAAARARRGQLEASGPDASWLDAVERWEGQETLTRTMVVDLVERVDVGEGRDVSVTFRFGDCIEAALGAVK